MLQIECNMICWHPDVATQLCIASEDDHAPVIQLWDLRCATSPLRLLERHQRYSIECFIPTSYGQMMNGASEIRHNNMQVVLYKFDEVEDKSPIERTFKMLAYQFAKLKAITQGDC